MKLIISNIAIEHHPTALIYPLVYSRHTKADKSNNENLISYVNGHLINAAVTKHIILHATREKQLYLIKKVWE